MWRDPDRDAQPAVHRGQRRGHLLRGRRGQRRLRQGGLQLGLSNGVKIIIYDAARGRDPLLLHPRAARHQQLRVAAQPDQDGGGGVVGGHQSGEDTSIMETVMVMALVSACTGGRQTPARPRPSEEKRVIRRSKARSCVKSNILDYKIKCIYENSEFAKCSTPNPLGWHSSGVVAGALRYWYPPVFTENNKNASICWNPSYNFQKKKGFKTTMILIICKPRGQTIQE